MQGQHVGGKIRWWVIGVGAIALASCSDPRKSATSPTPSPSPSVSADPGKPAAAKSAAAKPDTKPDTKTTAKTTAKTTTKPDTKESTKPNPKSSAKPTTQSSPVATPFLSPGEDPFTSALDKAQSARSISESANSPEDWQFVATRWQDAIALLKVVPKQNPNHAKVNAKLAEFNQKLADAKNQAIQSALPAPIVAARSVPIPEELQRGQSTSPAMASGGVYQAVIKRRLGGTPVIDVTFNGQQTYEMIVDTGASGTVITAQMAQALNVPVIGKASVTTASERNVEVPVALVRSMSAGGAVILNVPVAVGNEALDVGLLGHDFFEGFDIIVKRDVVEFRPN